MMQVQGERAALQAQLAQLPLEGQDSQAPFRAKVHPASALLGLCLLFTGPQLSACVLDATLQNVCNVVACECLQGTARVSLTWQAMIVLHKDVRGKPGTVRTRLCGLSISGHTTCQVSCLYVCRCGACRPSWQMPSRQCRSRPAMPLPSKPAWTQPMTKLPSSSRSIANCRCRNL